MHPLCTRETPRCVFWDWSRNELRPTCCTQHLVELLHFVTDLLTRHGIFHWLDYGSLLGAIRTGDLIPWDLDGDISCWRTDFKKIKALEAEISAAGHWLDLRDAPYILRIHYSRINHMHVDLWLCEVQAGLVKIGYYSNADEWSFPITYVAQLSQLTLCGKAFPTPFPLDAFMVNHRYGADYLTPQQQPEKFDWTHLPLLRNVPDTPLLQYLFQEIRGYDQIIAVARRKDGSLIPRQTFIRRLLKRAFFLMPAFSKWVITPLRTLMAYPVALHYWLTQPASPQIPRALLRDLTPPLALLILELYRRKSIVAKIRGG